MTANLTPRALHHKGSRGVMRVTRTSELSRTALRRVDSRRRALTPQQSRSALLAVRLYVGVGSLECSELLALGLHATELRERLEIQRDPTGIAELGHQIYIREGDAVADQELPGASMCELLQ